MEYFETTEKFKEQFSFDTEEAYFDPIALQDRKVAFSIKRKYPDTIRYKAALTKEGEADNIAALWVIYTQPDLSSKDAKINRVPVRIRIGNMSLYRTEHYDYDFEDPKSPTVESLEKSASTPMPIDLEYDNEFFYDHERSEFTDVNGTALTGIEILNRVFSEHCDTVHRIKGLKLRFKLLVQSKGTGLISESIKAMELILKRAFGRTLEESDSMSSFYDGYKYDGFKKLNEDSLNVFGYKAAKQVIVIFCIIIISGAFLRYSNNITGGYFEFVGKSNFLSMAHGLFLLWFLDVVVPNILFWSVNLLIKGRKLIMFMRFKAK